MGTETGTATGKPAWKLVEQSSQVLPASLNYYSPKPRDLPSAREGEGQLYLLLFCFLELLDVI